jgi:signal transduction histidine kinase
LVLGNVQIRSKLLSVVIVPLLALVVFATVQVVSSERSRVEADRLNRATQFASSLTALVDALQRERAISRGYVASARRANFGTMMANRALVDSALLSFRRNLRSLDTHRFSDRFRRDVRAASDTFSDLADFRSRMESQPLTSGEVAGYFGGQIGALLAVISDIGAQQGSGALGNNVDALVAVVRAKEAASQSQGLLFSVLTARVFWQDEYQQFASLTGEEQAYLAEFREAATPAQRAFFSATVTGPNVDRTDAMRQAVLAAREVPAGIASTDWFFVSSARAGLLHLVELRVAGDLAAASGAARSAAARRATTELVAMILVVTLAVGSSLLIGRSMTQPLVLLERRVRQLATSELPGVVERLQHADDGAELAAIAAQDPGGLPVGSTDEIGRLATAFNSMHQVAVRVATEQAALRRSIGDMFVNLARRSQSLIDRQLNLIDELERGTESPDHLEDLFRLDHLATRMRRNAENLLVLASAEPGRRWSEPIPLADVMRAAGSEVEDFTRVEMLSGDEVLVAGHATSDMVHLLAELIENATAFSPPDTPVRVAARPTTIGYLIEVEDRGLGMTEDELSSANERLANPPEIDFALSRMLGFFVVGRLAERHGIKVQLRQSPYGGVTALVLIPPALLLNEPDTVRLLASGSRRSTAQLPAPMPWPEGDSAPAGAAASLQWLSGAELPALESSLEREGPADLRPLGQTGALEPVPDPLPTRRPRPVVDPAPARASGDGSGNVHDLLDGYRSGMVQGRVRARSRRPGRPPDQPPADGSPPAAS